MTTFESLINQASAGSKSTVEKKHEGKLCNKVNNLSVKPYLNIARIAKRCPESISLDVKVSKCSY